MAAFVNIFTENLKYLNLVFFLILIDNTEILKCLVNIKINSYLMKVVHKRQKNHRLYLSCQYLIKYKEDKSTWMPSSKVCGKTWGSKQCTTKKKTNVDLQIHETFKNIHKCSSGIEYD